MISVQLRVPTGTEGGYRDLMERLRAAAERDDRRRNGCRDTPSNPPEDPYGGYVLGWRFESTTTERRRNRLCNGSQSASTSEL